MNNFEAHVTLDWYSLKASDLVEKVESLAKELHCKTSRIDGDPILGEKIFFYLTFYDASFDNARERLDEIYDRLFDMNVHVIREKIEFVVYDERYPQ